MIGEPMPNPRDAIILDLNQKMDQFFGSGKTIQQIESGVSAEAPFFGTTAHHAKLRAERDKLAPAVKAQADAGQTASAAAVALKMHIKRVLLIASENNFKFADS